MRKAIQEAAEAAVRRASLYNSNERFSFNQRHIATLRPGAFAITVSHELPERLDFETVDSEILELDGCRTLVFISKKHPPGALGPPPGG